MADYSGGPSYHEMRQAEQAKQVKQKGKQDAPPDNVNHPAHYIKPWGEVIDITETLNFNLGNVIKYVLRHAEKNGLEDLKKAQWYLNREIARRER